MRTLSRRGRLFLLVTLLATLALPQAPALASVHTATRFSAKYEFITQGGVSAWGTTVWLTVCGQGAYYRIRSVEVTGGGERILWDEVYTNVNGCTTSYRVVVHAATGDQLRFYTMVMDQPVSDDEFLRRARVDEYTVTGNAQINGGEVPRSAVTVVITDPQAPLAGGSVTIKGEAADLAATTDTGISAVRASLIDSIGKVIPLGQATYGLLGSVIATEHQDERFLKAGFTLTADLSTAAQGQATLQVEALSSRIGTWTVATRPLEIDNGAPVSVTSIFPKSAAPNAGQVPIVVDGQGLTSVRSASLGDLQLQITNVLSNSLQVVVPVNRLTPGRTYDVVLETPRGLVSLPQAFTVDAQAVEPALVRAMVVIACDDPSDNASLLPWCEGIFTQLERAVDRNPNLKVLVLWDGPGDGDSAYYRVMPGLRGRKSYQPQPRVFEPMSELDTGSAFELEKFILWAHSQYPGTFKLFSLMGHGGGWAPSFIPPLPRSIRPPIPSGSGTPLGGMLTDAHPANSLGTYDLAWLLRRVNANGAADAGIDVLYLDACLMGATEVAAEIGGSTRFVVASENITWPFLGYDAFLGALTAVTGPDDLARQVVEATSATWGKGYPLQLAAINTDGLPVLLSALDGLADALILHLASDRPAIRAAVEGALHLNDSYGRSVPPDWILDANDTTMDLLDFSRKLQEQPVHPDIVAAAKTLEQALISDQVVRHAKAQPAYGEDGKGQWWPMDRLGGLSIYFPLNNTDWRRKYYTERALPTFAPHRWDDFVQAWHTAPPPPDPEPCADCGTSPARIRVAVEAPASIDVDQIDDIVYIPLTLHGALAADDMRDIELFLESRDLRVLEPADRSYRAGPRFPGGELMDVRRDGAGWRLIANLPPSRKPLGGDGVIVELPFRVRGVGAVDLRLTTHQLRTGALQAVPHQALHARVEVGATRAASVQGAVSLQWQPGAAAGIRLEARYGTSVRQLGVQEDGQFQAYLRPGVHTLAATYLYHLRAEREVRMSAGAARTLEPIVLWAGDLNETGRIHAADWRLCRAVRAPVNDTRYDLTGDGLVDGRDCQVIANNLGAVAPTRVNPPTPGASTQGALAAADEEVAGLQLCDRQGDSVGLCLAQDAAAYGFGARLRLPAGVTLVGVAWATPGGYTTDAHQVGDTLFLVAVLDEQEAAAPLRSAQPLARVYLGGGSAQLTLEGSSLVQERGWAQTVFLPLTAR